MKRIIWHWTGGTYTPNAVDLKHYHMLIDGDGNVHEGDLGPEANIDCTDGIYVRHTRGCNTAAIGIGICGMLGAKERPFSGGEYPIKPCQIDALVDLTADLCYTYDIPVTKSMTLSHAEVQPTLGIKQRNKWDIAWIPDHIDGTDDPVRIGNMIRARALLAMQDVPEPLEHAPEIMNLIEKSDDRKSKSIAATVTQFGAAASAVPLAVFAKFDDIIILAALVAITLLVSIYLFTSRRSKGRAARAARATLQ